MVTIYINQQNSSSRKAIAWLEEHGIEFHVRNVARSRLSKQELREILAITVNGTEEILSMRGDYSKKLDLDTMTLNELLDELLAEPSLMKTPLIIENRNLLAGFNVEEIRKFLPRKWRALDYARLKNENKLFIA